MADPLTRALSLPRRIIRRLVRRGPEDAPPATGSEDTPPAGVEPAHVEIHQKVQDFTMTSPERVYALCDAVGYIVKNGIEGALVECGVWRGGSAMAMAMTLLEHGVHDRELHLFDTFEGMTPPGPEDVDIAGDRASDLLAQRQRTQEDPLWCYSPIDAVRDAMASTGYPADKIHFHRGDVLETLPGRAPKHIALLRLDTDWYESTRHELECLYPRLADLGVLIIDDYGHWRGSRRAIDEYVQRNRLPLLLNRIDYTGRIAVKALRR
ncbi:MAG: class I SAM-dependent methyltransferase [Myxococcales bacterium]|nr:class I SAM-dependent methyltransferase [Myxococcales bacterium]